MTKCYKYNGRIVRKKESFNRTLAHTASVQIIKTDCIKIENTWIGMQQLESMWIMTSHYTCSSWKLAANFNDTIRDQYTDGEVNHFIQSDLLFLPTNRCETTQYESSETTGCNKCPPGSLFAVAFCVSLSHYEHFFSCRKSRPTSQLQWSCFPAISRCISLQFQSG